MKPEAPTVSFSLTVKRTADALSFYKAAFGAVELFRMPAPDGEGVFHAEFMIGNSHIYISDEAPDYHAAAMPEGGVASCLFAIAVPDCDEAFFQAVAAGATTLFEPTNQLWGVRNAMVLDPFGYRWTVGQQIEDVSPEELARRVAEKFG